MDLRQRIEAWCEEHAPDEPILLADGLEGAFIGLGYNAGNVVRACYDIEQCIRIIMLQDELSYDDAADYFAFNVQVAYIGDQTPIFVDRFALRYPQQCLN